MTTVVSGSSALARSKTCVHASLAEDSGSAAAMRIHRPFPQRWITQHGKVGVASAACRVSPSVVGGECGPDYSTGVFHTARRGKGLDTLSVVKTFVQRRWKPVYSFTGRPRAGFLVE